MAVSAKCVILMADYGGDPTEAAIPWSIFNDAGFDVHFATEKGVSPQCDERMLSGITGALLGANKAAKAAHDKMTQEPAYKTPKSWTDPSFDLTTYDLVFLPGGHEKRVRQLIDSPDIHSQLAKYVPLTKIGSGRKSLAAICHGVQVLATSKFEDGKSVIHDFETTALPGTLENVAFWGTRAFLGDYYKTYGAGSDNVQVFIEKVLDDPQKQWKGNSSSTPFIHKDPNHNYISARFPPDAELLSNEIVKMVKSNL